jgi:RNA polymerase sigma-70 factor (ECF subfamily)
MNRADFARRFSPPDVVSDGAVVQAWFERYRRALYAYFLRHTRQRADAEDLVQDVFVRLSRVKDVSGIRDSEAFLFETAANLLKDWARRKRTHGMQFDPASENFEVRDREPGPDRVLLAKAELSEVVQALNGLGEKTRRIFILRRLEQVKCQEIASLYGISVKAVERHIAQALLHLSKATPRT